MCISDVPLARGVCPLMPPSERSVYNPYVYVWPWGRDAYLDHACICKRAIVFSCESGNHGYHARVTKASCRVRERGRNPSLSRARPFPLNTRRRKLARYHCGVYEARAKSRKKLSNTCDLRTSSTIVYFLRGEGEGMSFTILASENALPSRHSGGRYQTAPAHAFAPL